MTGPAPSTTERSVLRALVVYGTRPEAIKLAPLIIALQECDDIEVIIVTTGQHPHMVDQVHGDYGITANHDLGIFRRGQGLDQMTALVLQRLGPIIASERPDVMVVQGDTTSCFAAAVASVHAQVPLVHLEAGMRSHDKRAPFPEEVYRRLVAQTAALHLAASPANRENLLMEGINEDDILVVGSTAIDALQEMLRTPVDLGELSHIAASSGLLVVLTCHRRESWGDPMRRMAGAFARVARSHRDVTFLLSAHPNLTVRESLLPSLNGIPNVVVTEPLTYRVFAALMRRAHLLVTDSGGVQAEAPSLEVPTLVLRDNTEYVESVRSGTARLIGTDPMLIESEMSRLLDDPAAHSAMRIGFSPYGDGQAGKRSARAIVSMLRTGRHATEPFVPTPGAGIIKSSEAP